MIFVKKNGEECKGCAKSITGCGHHKAAIMESAGKNVQLNIIETETIMPPQVVEVEAIIESTYIKPTVLVTLEVPSLSVDKVDDDEVDDVIKVAEEDIVSDYNKDKAKYFNSLGFILGNVKLTFLDGGKKKVNSCCKWKELTRSESITGRNFLIRTGIKSFITVFDVDIKPDCNGADNLMDAGIDFDEYTDECIKIKTQSGGSHYIFKYDQRFKTGANCFGVKGFDIRNDEGVIFAGERYDVISIGQSFDEPSGLDQIFDTLSEHEEGHILDVALSKNQVRPKTHQKSETCSGEVDEKYFEIFSYLSDEWFNGYDKWVKPIYAIKNADDIDNESALATILRLLNERADTPNDEETRRVFALDSSKKRFNMGSIINEIKKTRYDDWKAWNDKWYPKKQRDDNEKKKSLLDILKEKLLEIVEDKYRREFQSGAIYEKQLPYYYTRKYEDPSVFLNHVFADEALYHSCKSKDHHELIYFIKNITNPAFEFMAIDYNYIGFRNGMYDLSTASFIYSKDVSSNIQVRKFIDQDFQIKEDTSYLDGYLKFQFQDENIKFIYFMIGRLMTRLTDKFDFMVMLYGEGGSGKSLLVNLLKYIFGSDQIGILSNSFQDKFGLSEFTDKQVVCCDDMPNNLAKIVPKSDFLSMQTRGALSCPVKGKGSIQVHDWNIGTIMNTNKLPNYSDVSGEIVRRVMIINFENVIEESKRNTELESDIINNEIGIFIHRCRSTYLEYATKYKGKGVESFCPQVFIENRNLLRMATNNSYQFIVEKFAYQEGAKMTIPDLNREFKLYIKDRFDLKKSPSENINTQSIISADSRYVYEKTNICKHCHTKHKKGCCAEYKRDHKTTKEIIYNITHAYNVDPILNPTVGRFDNN